jgi:hypothetical protein
MKPLSLVLATALALAAVADGQPPFATGLHRDDQPPPPTVMVVKMTLHPVGPSEPDLRFKLLPEVRDREPGNAALLYYRAYSPEWFVGNQVRRDKELDQKLEKWRSETPLKELPVKELDWLLNSNDLREVDRAARRSYCDWEFVPRLREDGIGALLPDVQGFREVTRFLAIRTRLQVAQGKYADAVRTLQTGFQLDRDLAEGPTLIHDLVGIACGMILLERLEELIQQPDAPNFYWPLTDLPQPFVNLRKGFEGERLTTDWLFPGGRELLANPNAPRPGPEKFRSMQKMIHGLADDSGPKFEVSVKHLDENAAALPEARRVLKGYGWTDAQIDSQPGGVANMLLEVHNYDRYYDEFLRWYGQPYPVAREQFARSDAKLKAAKDVPGTVLARLLLPAVGKVINASERIDRRIAGLRVVEAVRLYAAAHGGKLPATLADITDVPVPDDPVHARPFGYTVEGDKAVLTGPPPAGVTPNSSNNLRYELTLAK